MSSYVSKHSLSKEDAYRILKEMTEEDFGYDVEAWENYFEQYDLGTMEGFKVVFKGQVKIAEKWEKNRKTKPDSESSE